MFELKNFERYKHHRKKMLILKDLKVEGVLIRQLPIQGDLLALAQKYFKSNC